MEESLIELSSSPWAFLGLALLALASAISPIWRFLIFFAGFTSTLFGQGFSQAIGRYRKIVDDLASRLRDKERRHTAIFEWLSNIILSLAFAIAPFLAVLFSFAINENTCDQIDGMVLGECYRFPTYEKITVIILFLAGVVNFASCVFRAVVAIDAVKAADRSE